MVTTMPTLPEHTPSDAAIVAAIGVRHGMRLAAPTPLPHVGIINAISLTRRGSDPPRAGDPGGPPGGRAARRGR